MHLLNKILVARILFGLGCHFFGACRCYHLCCTNRKRETERESEREKEREIRRGQEIVIVNRNYQRGTLRHTATLRLSFASTCMPKERDMAKHTHTRTHKYVSFEIYKICQKRHTFCQKRLYVCVYVYFC